MNSAKRAVMLPNAKYQSTKTNTCNRAQGTWIHMAAYCSPSPHKNGSKYEIMGTLEPQTCGENRYLQLFEIYNKYGLGIDKDNKIPITSLFEKDLVVPAGHNRHEVLLRMMESLIQRNRSILEMERIKALAKECNNIHCNPPLDDEAF